MTRLSFAAGWVELDELGRVVDAFSPDLADQDRPRPRHPFVRIDDKVRRRLGEGP